MRQEAGAAAGTNDVVVILTAVAAELDGHEESARAGECLAFEGELAGGGGFQRGEYRPALADELVKLEGEGSTTIVAESDRRRALAVRATAPGRGLGPRRWPPRGGRMHP